MRKKQFLSFVIVGLLALVSFSSFAQGDKIINTEPEGAVHSREDVNQFIRDEQLDAHYLIFFERGDEGKFYGFPLPVILIDNGLKMFSASRFDHGNILVYEGGQYYRLYDNQIYKTDADGDLQLDENGWPTNEQPLDFSITKNVFATLIIGILMLLLFMGMAKHYRKNTIPKGFYRALEPVVLFVRDDIAKSNIGPRYRKFLSWLLTIFFFILIMNLLSVFPFGLNVTGDITVTCALALITFVITQVVGNKHYWKHIFWFPGIPWPLKIVLAPLELLGIFTKPFALMVRLFANMLGGHISVMSLLGLIVVFESLFGGIALFGGSVFLELIHILEAVLQAYIFTLLSAIYIGMAVEDPHDQPQDPLGEEIPVI